MCRDPRYGGTPNRDARKILFGTAPGDLAAGEVDRVLGWLGSTASFPGVASPAWAAESCEVRGQRDEDCSHAAASSVKRHLGTATCRPSPWSGRGSRGRDRSVAERARRGQCGRRPARRTPLRPRPRPACHGRESGREGTGGHDHGGTYQHRARRTRLSCATVSGAGEAAPDEHASDRSERDSQRAGSRLPPASSATVDCGEQPLITDPRRRPSLPGPVPQIVEPGRCHRRPSSLSTATTCHGGNARPAR